MSTAQGVFVRNSTNHITLVFVINETQVTCSGTVSPSIPPFTTKNVTLTYNDINKMSSTRSYSGRIGQNRFKLDFDNGFTAEGDLNPPGVIPAMVVNGAGRGSNSLLRLLDRLVRQL
ncbi:hypothetical protein FSHL1_001222 [Fusarium sambucinum]